MPKVLSHEDIAAFRERVCDVAEELFATRGPDGVTMRELAQALGVSSMTAYRYFADKDAILAAVRTRAFHRFSEAMEKAKADYDREKTKPKKPPAKSSKKSVDMKQGPGRAYLAFALENPAAYKLMFDINQPTRESYPDLVAAMSRAKATMGPGVLAISGAKRFRGDPELGATMLWSAMHGAVMLELAGLLGSHNAQEVAGPTLEALAAKLGMVD